MRKQTTLSAGRALHEMLEPMVAAGRVTQIVHVITDEAELPYIVYRRSGLDTTSVKARAVRQSSGEDNSAASPRVDENATVLYEVTVFAGDDEECVGLAEEVRELLDNVAGYAAGYIVRSSRMTDAQELWTDDAYAQTMTFELKLFKSY